MPFSYIDVTDLSIPRSTAQQSTVASASQFWRRGINIISSNPDRNTTGVSNPQNLTYEVLTCSTSDSATGTVTIAGVLAADTVTVNGLVYTAVSGAKANNTQFTIDGTDTASAEDLAASVQDDTRTGTIGDLQAASTAAVVTMTSTLNGTEGNAVTLVSSNGTRLAVSGSTFSGGRSGPATYNIYSREVVIPSDVGSISLVQSDFFENVTVAPNSQVIILPIENKNGKTYYQVFWAEPTDPNGNNDSVRLVVNSVRTPSNIPPAEFPLLSDQQDPDRIVMKLRQDDGIEKVYDCFYFIEQ